MKTVARNLVRISNHMKGIDEHEFAYDVEDATSFETWEGLITSMLNKHGIEESASEWHDRLQEKMHVAGEKSFSGHSKNGWLITIRQDRIQAGSMCLHANDNAPAKTEGEEDILAEG